MQTIKEKLLVLLAFISRWQSKDDQKHEHPLAVIYGMQPVTDVIYLDVLTWLLIHYQ